MGCRIRIRYNTIGPCGNYLSVSDDYSSERTATGINVLYRKIDCHFHELSIFGRKIKCFLQGFISSAHIYIFDLYNLILRREYMADSLKTVLEPPFLFTYHNVQDHVVSVLHAYRAYAAEVLDCLLYVFFDDAVVLGDAYTFSGKYG